MKIGIDIGGSHIAAGIVLESGKFVAKESKDLNLNIVEDNVEEIIVDTIKNLVKILLSRYGFDEGDISKIGVAVPGSPKDGKIRNLVNLGIKEFDLASVLKDLYQTEVSIKNDGKCAGLAEKRCGSLKKYKDAVFLCIGTGVGSAFFLHDELLEGSNEPGFEVGHMVINKEGKDCNCGNKGCFETYASMKRFKQDAVDYLELDKNMDSEVLQDYIRSNLKDKKVKEFVNSYLDNVAIGIANIINLFEPEAISFGGSFSYYDDIFLDDLKTKVMPKLFNKDRDIDFVVAKLKNDAGIIGAVS